MFSNSLGNAIVFVSMLAANPGAQQASSTLPAASSSGTSSYARTSDFRCGTADLTGSVQALSSGDCPANSTTINPNYDPAGHALYRIPVVVHVITSSSGEGAISDAMIQSQIDILNEDFQALSGSPGQFGTNTGISFHLATHDPAGNPTNGITRTVNDSWFHDTGDYYGPLAWDPENYLNFYTIELSNGLGFALRIPQLASPSLYDGITIHWAAFGRNAPIGPPFNQGRTATHQVGHHLGLRHTFLGSCVGPNAPCYTSGDFLCDTEPEALPTRGCPSSRDSCSTPDPFHNYMDYTDDVCMQEFTPEQANRMRCTLVNWRPDLAESQSCAATVTIRTIGFNVNGLSATRPVLGSTLTLGVVAPGWTSAYLYANARAGWMPFANGMWLLVDNGSPRYFARTLNMPNASMSIRLPSDMSLCGAQACVQALLTGGSPGFAFTNAVDLTLGL